MQLEQVTKGYREGFVTIKNASITVKQGEIRGILGENGAGKSTLVKIVSGVLPPDSGKIWLDGVEYHAQNPAQAASLGIIKLRKKPDLVPGLTVAENIVLGNSTEGVVFNRKQAVKITEELIERFHIELDPNALAGHLNEEDTLETELLKAVHHGVKLLIIDEPSTHVSMGQIEYLFEMLRRLAENGVTVLYITNRAKEALHVCDTITVMTDGTTGKTLDADKATEIELKALMNSNKHFVRPDKKQHALGDEVLWVEDLATFKEPGTPALEDVDLTIRQGEVVAVVGNADSGAKELCYAIAGMMRIVGGKISLFDEDITHDGVKGTRDLGVSLLISQPRLAGVAPKLSIQENLLPSQYANPEYLHHGLIDNDKLTAKAQELICEYDIECNSVNDLASTLSAASAQKLLFARECSSEPVLLVAYRPTAGTSEENAAMLRRKLLDLRNAGTAILLVPTDPEEYRALADTTVVLHKGRVAATKQGRMTTLQMDAYSTGKEKMTTQEMEAMRLGKH